MLLKLKYTRFVFLISFIFTFSARAENLLNPVIDRASFFSDSERYILTDNLNQLRHQKNIYMAVLVLETLGGQTIESIAEQEFKRYGLGIKGVDNGLLLILALKERQMRFEVGYGLEGDLPDAVTKRLLDDVLRPYLRNNKATDGILKIIHILNTGNFDSISKNLSTQKTTNPWAISLTTLGLGLFFLLFLVLFKNSPDKLQSKRVEKLLGQFRPADWSTFLKKEKLYLKLQSFVFWTFIFSLTITTALPWSPVSEIVMIIGLLFIFVFGFICIGLIKLFDAQYSWIRLYQESPSSLKSVIKKELLSQGYKYSKEKDSFEQPPRSNNSAGSSSSSRSSSSSSSSSSYSSGGRSGGGGSSSSW